MVRVVGAMSVIIYHCLTVGNLLCKQAEARLPSPRAYTLQYNILFKIYLCERVNRWTYYKILRRDYRAFGEVRQKPGISFFLSSKCFL